MDFENANNDVKLDKFTRAVAENFTNIMANYPEVFILDRQDVNRYLDEIDRSASQSKRVTRFQQLGQRLDFDFMVVGSVAKYDNLYLIQCRLFSVKRGEIIPGTARQKTCRTESEIIEVCRILGEQMVKEVRQSRSWLSKYQ